MNASDLLADRIILRTLDLSKYSNGILKRKVIPILLLLRDDLVAMVSNLELVGTESEKARRMKMLLASATDTIQAAYKRLQASSVEVARDIAEVEASAAVKDVNSVLAFDLLSPGLSQSSMDAVLKRSTVLGTPASEWWERQSASLISRYIDQVRIGILQSQSTGDIVRRVRGLSTGKYTTITLKNGESRKLYHFTGGIMDITTRDATSLVRTSVHSVANNARMAAYRQNSDLIKGVQALVTLDSRTSRICISRSGMSWDLEGNPLEGTDIKFPGPTPWHFNCRTTLIPLIRSWADLMSGNAVSKAKMQRLEDNLKGTRTQSSMDGQVAGDLTYETWLKSKPEEFQKEVLGPSRWSMWAEGKISLSQLVDSGGDELTLDQLRQLHT